MDNFQPKSFWEKPEGTTGMLFLAAAIIGGGYGLYLLLPFLIAMAANTLTLMLMLGAIGAIFYVIMDPKFRTLISYGYKSIMRAMTGVFITIDPIGILKNYLSELRANLEKMCKQVSNLAGQIKVLEIEISKNKENIDRELKIASKAKENGQNQVVTLKARQAGRLGDSNKTLGQILLKMQSTHRVLTKMKEVSEILVEDIGAEIDVKTREKKAIDASYGAFKSAMAIIKGNTSSKQIFDETMEFLAEDYGRKVGEIEEFMTASSGFISSIDLQNMVYEEDALKSLEAWEKKTDSILLPFDQKNDLIQTKTSKVMVKAPSAPKYFTTEIS